MNSIPIDNDHDTFYYLLPRILLIDTILYGCTVRRGAARAEIGYSRHGRCDSLSPFDQYSGYLHCSFTFGFFSTKLSICG